MYFAEFQEKLIGEERNSDLWRRNNIFKCADKIDLVDTSPSWNGKHRELKGEKF